MKRRKLIWHIYPPFLLIALLALVLTTWYVSRTWQDLYVQRVTEDLEIRVQLVAYQVDPLLLEHRYQEANELLRVIGPPTKTRFTIILPNGRVVGDSAKKAGDMENHGDRPEIVAALAGKAISLTRMSFTLNKRLIYVAVPLKEGNAVTGVLRAAMPVTAVEEVLLGIYLKILGGGLVIVLGAAILSLLVIRRLSQPLAEIKRGAERLAGGDLSAKLAIPSSDELGSLAEALNHMAAELDDRFRTILQQRQDQEAILSSMVEGVIAVDNQDRLITLNKAGARLLKVDPAAVRHLSIQEVIRNKELQFFLKRTRLADQPLEGEIILNGQQQQRYLQVHGSTLRDAHATAIGVLLVLNDVTRLRRLERVRRDFVANVSHELRTPITSIKGFVETLLGGAMNEPDNATGFLEIIARQADRLNQIIEDLLTLSRIEQEEEQGQVVLKTEPLRPVLEAAMQLCAGRAADKNITLQLQCPADLQAPINGPLLEGAMVNLIDNAIKYSPPHSTVVVKSEAGAEQVVIQVRDQGRGIPAEHLPRLFERFYRVDPSRSRKVGGTGLGLAIVKHIAKAHSGWVTVDSKPDEGSVFSLHLPQIS